MNPTRIDNNTGTNTETVEDNADDDDNNNNEPKRWNHGALTFLFVPEGYILDHHVKFSASEIDTTLTRIEEWARTNNIKSTYKDGSQDRQRTANAVFETLDGDEFSLDIYKSTEEIYIAEVQRQSRHAFRHPYDNMLLALIGGQQVEPILDTLRGPIDWDAISRRDAELAILTPTSQDRLEEIITIIHNMFEQNLIQHSLETCKNTTDISTVTRVTCETVAHSVLGGSLSPYVNNIAFDFNHEFSVLSLHVLAQAVNFVQDVHDWEQLETKRDQLVQATETKPVDMHRKFLALHILDKMNQARDTTPT